MQKARYEVDPYNRLIVDGNGGAKGLPKFRKVLDGRFNIDENSNLYYHVKAPLSQAEGVPHQIKLKGIWSLDDNHNLRLTLDKLARETFGDEITLRGEMLGAGKNSLLFAVTTVTKTGARSTYVLNFSGSWKADETNRLSFHVKRQSGRYDVLTFAGAWEINDDHQIIYEYEKAELIRKRRNTHTLIFKGHWDVKAGVRISYLLGKTGDSTFEFKASAGIFKKDRVQYEIGIGLAGRARPLRRVITLFGEWRIINGTGLVFEAEYGRGRVEAISFGADAKLTDNDTVSFRLKDGEGKKDMGIVMELSHKMLKGDGIAFLRALKSRGELAIYAGAARQW